MQDLRYAARALRRSPSFTVIAALTLALGIGASAAIFTVIDGVLLEPLPYGHPEQLAGAWHDLAPLGMKHAQQTQGTYFTYARLAHSLDGIAVYQTGAVNVADPGGATEPRRVTAAFVTASLIPLLEVSPFRGRNFTAEEDAPNGPLVAIISEGMWRGRFGSDPQILRRTIDINGRTRQIVGVMPSRFRFPAAATELWLPTQLDPLSKAPGGFSYDGVARLKRGVTLDAAQRDLASVLPRFPELFPFVVPGVSSQMLMDQGKPVPVLVPLKEDVTGAIAGTLWVVAGAAGLMLLVACANVTNLILVRLDGRQRELAVREALGAGRGHVLAHLLAESALLAGLGAVGGFALAWGAVRALVAAAPSAIPRLAEVGMGGRAIAFTIAIAALAAMACSLVPVMRFGRGELSGALREGGRAGTAGRVRQRVRGALVAAQMALALVVLAGSGLLMRTFQRLNAVRPGYDPEHVMTFWMSLPSARYPSDTDVVRFYSQVTDRVSRLGGVSAAAVTSQVPLETFGGNWDPFYPENDPSYDTRIPPLQTYATVSAGYFAAMKIPLIAGRTFEGFDSKRSDDAIISRRTAEIFYHDSTGAAALGKRFRELPSGRWFTVVGVTANTRDTSLTEAASPVVYLPKVAVDDPVDVQGARTMALVVRTAGDPVAITAPVQRVLHDLDATIPLFQVQPMTDVFQASMAQLRFVMLILAAAAVVTLLLGSIGLYGVMAYVVTLRTRELGVRVALGAAPGAVAAMMAWQGLVLTVGGLAAGLALFLLVARFLRSLLVGVAPNDPVALGAASVLLVAIAGIASWIPARRAARVDPAEALRAE